MALQPFWKERERLRSVSRYLDDVSVVAALTRLRSGTGSGTGTLLKIEIGRHVGASDACVNEAALSHERRIKHVSSIDDDGITQLLMQASQIDVAKLVPTRQHQQRV